MRPSGANTPVGAASAAIHFPAIEAGSRLKAAPTGVIPSLSCNMDLMRDQPCNIFRAASGKLYSYSPVGLSRDLSFDKRKTLHSF